MATARESEAGNGRGFTYVHRTGQKAVSGLREMVGESQICQAWGLIWIYLTAIPVLVLVSAKIGSIWREEIWNGLWDDMITNFDLVTSLSFFAVFLSSLYVHFISYSRSIYLIDFACYKPGGDDLKVTKDEFMELIRRSGKFNQESLEFQERILRSSGIGDETYVPKSIASCDNIMTMKEGRAEASEVMFGALDELFEKTRINPKDVGIIVVNCSIFNPTPSLSSMIINHYNMRVNILNFNLGGMGCSAGIISLDLARYMLQANPNNYAVVVSTEMVAYNWYPGQNRSMLIPNCFFRMGCSAVLLSNRLSDHTRAKYRLEHIVRTHKGADDRAFRSVYQEDDEGRLKGLKVSKYVMKIGVDALKTNITSLGLLGLPFSERHFSFPTLIRHYLSFAMMTSKKTEKPYVPNYKLAFNHFCMHASSKAALNELQRALELNERNMEASRATLHRFGNTSSSSIWYVLAYLEAKERVCRGDRVLQLAFGSGFKCNSIVWRAMDEVKRPTLRNNPWIGSIESYPVAMN